MDKREFLETENYFINEIDEKGHIIQSGNSKFILSAPHSVSQIRRGKEKIGEYRTGVIVKDLNRRTNSHVIYKTRNYGEDANYDNESIYRTELKKYIIENKLELLLDFHIAAPKHSFDIDIGTGYNKNIIKRYDILKFLVKKFEDFYPTVVVDDPLPSAKNNTICKRISHDINVPAFQIEINWKIIDNYKKTMKFIENMKLIIDELEKKF